MNKILVAYFSAGGTTAATAKGLAQASGADLYEIRPEVPYTSADLDWTNQKSRSSMEMKDKEFRPALADKDAEIDAYETIFLGFPIWWYVAPTIINTFLESYDFSGKKIVLFATSGGSGFGNTLRELSKSVNGTAAMTEGRILNGKHSADDLKAWVNSIL